jgi:hypothetical protein
MSTLFSRLAQSGQDYSSLMGQESGEIQSRDLATEQLKAAAAQSQSALKSQLGTDEIQTGVASAGVLFPLVKSGAKMAFKSARGASNMIRDKGANPFRARLREPEPEPEPLDAPPVEVPRPATRFTRADRPAPAEPAPRAPAPRAPAPAEEFSNEAFDPDSIQPAATRPAPARATPEVPAEEEAREAGSATQDLQGARGLPGAGEVTQGPYQRIGQGDINKPLTGEDVSNMTDDEIANYNRARAAGSAQRSGQELQQDGSAPPTQPGQARAAEPSEEEDEFHDAPEPPEPEAPKPSLGQDIRQNIKKGEEAGGGEGEEAAAELPGVSEAIMAGVAIGGVIKGIFQAKKEAKEMKAQVQEVANTPVQKLAIDSSPTFDSTFR